MHKNRLDRLLLLLDTGSTTSVRTTAAKQLAQLAVKSVTSDINVVEDDVKSTRQHVSQVDRSAWNDLMAVVARVRRPSFIHLLLSLSRSTRYYPSSIPNLSKLVLLPQWPSRKYALFPRSGCLPPR